MQNKIYSRGLKSLYITALLFCFILLRFNEDFLFYDPFLAYFRSDFNRMPLPDFDTLRLILNLMLRYGLNMLISLGLIYVIFKDKMMIHFSILLYLVAFFVLLIAFLGIIQIYGSTNNFLLFYVRRFLIQPIFVLLFIPGFYYQKIRNSF